MERVCKICGKIFSASKYRPLAQIICSESACQHKRQLENMKQWRLRNLHYFKQDEIRGIYWYEVCRRRIKRWRKEHPEYFVKYREKYKDRHREYMKEYMRRYRNIKKRMEIKDQEIKPATENVEPFSSPDQSPQTT